MILLIYAKHKDYFEVAGFCICLMNVHINALTFTFQHSFQMKFDYKVNDISLFGGMLA